QGRHPSHFHDSWTRASRQSFFPPLDTVQGSLLVLTQQPGGNHSGVLHAVTQTLQVRCSLRSGFHKSPLCSTPLFQRQAVPSTDSAARPPRQFCVHVSVRTISEQPSSVVRPVCYP